MRVLSVNSATIVIKAFIAPLHQSIMLSGVLEISE